MTQWNPKEKIFLITGGASGLGAEYVQAFLDLGAKGVAIVDIAEEAGKSLAERLNKVHGNKAVFIKCDVSKEDDITRAFEAVLAQFKQIDVIINNAGIMADAPNVWRTSCDVNWMDPFYENTGIRVLTVCLGATDTPLLVNLEVRAYDPSLGKTFASIAPSTNLYQKMESAVKAVVDMFNTGAPGTIWLSLNNKPVRNITATIDKAFKDFENLILG